MSNAARWVLCAAIASSGCGPGRDVDIDAGLPRVVATTGMIADAARIIGGEHVEVTALMGPGVDPHLYIASREDQKRLRAADLVLWHGLHLEGKMVEYLRALEDERRAIHGVAAVAEVLPENLLLRNAAMSEYPDPHVWFDLRLWSVIVAKIALALSERFPEHAEDFQAREDSYLAELRTTHEWAIEQAARLPPERRRIVTSHDAYSYFAAAYGFDVRSLQGISTDTQPGLKNIRDAATYIRESHLTVIFAETSVPRSAVEKVASEAGCRVCEHELYSDALGAEGSDAETFLGMFRRNVTTIVDALAPVTESSSP